MSNIVIKVENLSKLYRLGEVGTGTMGQDLNRWWASVRGKEDPFATVGETNDRTSKGKSDFVWSLKDIDFEVKQGEVLGIIGRNGAGKSTLLKILSKITAPTTGSVKVNGRIASLLEVGTGFHPELSGRENIFLNGAILGMSKAEIRSKFDEIVDFSGVERYIDTPVKRYSSGMYVRLAFAVAAFLEPEILIVDEVLAVGDAEFQKKCLGRMKDVSVNDGRTVLFVSHNLEAVQNLCDRTIVMSQGSIIYSGSPIDTVSKYISQFTAQITSRDWQEDSAPGNDKALLLQAKVKNSKTDSDIYFNTNDGFKFYFKIKLLESEIQELDVTYHLIDERGILATVSSSVFTDESFYFSDGYLHVYTEFPGNVLEQGIYTVAKLFLVRNRNFVLTEWNDILSFEIIPFAQGGVGWQGGKEGVVKINNLPWKLALRNEY